MSPTDSPRESWSSSPRRISGVPPSSATADLERDARARRGLLEHQRDALARERARLPRRSTARPSAPARGRAERSARRRSAPRRSGSRGPWEAEHGTRLTAHTWAVEIRAITWNLFHGRDFPPDPALYTWRSRLRRVTERNATHVQVNRELFREFAEVLCAARWDVALLQECPPRWSAALAAACKAVAQRSLTSRNWLGPVRGILARRNPDLLGSWEGGSNLTLARGLGADAPARPARPRPSPPSRAAHDGLRRGSTPASASRTCTRARAPAGGGGGAPRRRGGRRLGGRSAADPGRRLQSAPQPDPAVRGAGDRASASAPRPAPTPSTTSSPEGSRSSTRRAPGRPRRGSCPARAFDCASATTLRSRPGSPAADG